MGQRRHVTLHLTEWPEFAEIDPARLAGLVRTPRMLDARNTLDPAIWREAGWEFRAIGRPGASGPTTGTAQRTP